MRCRCGGDVQHSRSVNITMHCGTVLARLPVSLGTLWAKFITAGVARLLQSTAGVLHDPQVHTADSCCPGVREGGHSILSVAHCLRVLLTGC